MYVKALKKILVAVVTKLAQPHIKIYGTSLLDCSASSGAKESGHSLLSSLLISNL